MTADNNNSSASSPAANKLADEGHGLTSEGATPKKIQTNKEGWLYETPAAALKAVHERYYYWSSKLTDSSYTLSLAVIGANWAVFGSLDKIRQNPWSQWSVATVILALGINLFGIKWLSEAHADQVSYGESHREEWRKSFEETAGVDNVWPYTPGIAVNARRLRGARTWLPLLGGSLFLIALFTSPPKQPDHQSPSPSQSSPTLVFSVPEWSFPSCEWVRLGLHPRNADGALLPEPCCCESRY